MKQSKSIITKFLKDTYKNIAENQHFKIIYRLSVIYPFGALLSLLAMVMLTLAIGGIILIIEMIGEPISEIVKEQYLDYKATHQAEEKEAEHEGYRKFAKETLNRLTQEKLDFERSLSFQTKTTINQLRAKNGDESFYGNESCISTDIEKMITCSDLKRDGKKIISYDFLIKRFESMITNDSYPYIFKNGKLEDNKS